MIEFEKVVLLARRSAAERSKIARSFGRERNKIARRYRRKGISWLGNVLKLPMILFLSPPKIRAILFLSAADQQAKSTTFWKIWLFFLLKGG